jgi:hypothetical protein
MKKRQKISHIELLQENLDVLRVVCECGHTKRIPVFVDSVICNQCGRKLKNNSKAYFTYKLRKEIKKLEKN